MRAISGLLAAAALAITTAWADEPVRVMVVGTVHLSNPNADKMNVAVDDVLSAKRQAELAELNAALMGFQPNVVAVEWPADLVAERFPKFLAGTLEPSRNEVVQIGFRLAKSAGLDTVYGIDADGDFPFEAVSAYAEAHGQSGEIDAAWKTLETAVAGIQQAVDGGTLGGVLYYLNEPARIAADHGFYRAMLRIGGGEEQPGALLLAAWQTRNLKICAKLIQLTKPGDRVVLFFGSGHAFLLRQCVTETPGFELVEPLPYLPQ